MQGSPNTHRPLPNRGTAVLALGIAVVFGAGTALALGGGERVKSLDEPAFLDIGSNIAQHFQFAHTNTPERDVDGFDASLPAGSLRATAYRAPGYAYFIAPFIRLGAGYRTLRIVNAALMALTLLLAYRLLLRTHSATAAVIGVALVVGYPVLLYAASTLYPQTLSAFLLVACISVLERLHTGARGWAFAGAGLLYGLLVLTVPVYLLLTPVVLVWLVWSRRARLRQTAVAGLVIMACVGLWTTRNFLAFRSPVAMGTSSGFVLLSGNCPNTRYDQASVDVRWPEYVYTELVGKDEVERDRIMTRAALRFATENPGRAAVLYLQKLAYWFHYRNEVLSERVVPGGSGAGPIWLRDLIMLLTYGTLLALAVVRLALIRRFPLTSLEALLVLFYLSGGMAYAIYLTRIRYRLPFDWLLIILDAAFLATWIESRRQGERRSGPASATSEG